jgi:hypothetical protein
MLSFCSRQGTKHQTIDEDDIASLLGDQAWQINEMIGR